MAWNPDKRKSKKRQQADNQDGVTALYIRVSTEGQADEGFSLAEQETRLRAYCVANGWAVDDEHIYIDAGVSGKSTDRPAYQKMIQAGRDGLLSRIVVVKLDRMARNTKDFLHTVDILGGLGVDLVLIKENFDTSTPHGKFALTMFAAIAELEASTITERVMGGKQQKASEGGYNGSTVPYGYNYDGDVFTVDRTAAPIIQDIFHTYVNEAGSMSGIAKSLNAGNVPTATGAQWYAGTVRYVLRNGFYAGLVQWDGQEVEGSHPPIIDRHVYEAARDRLRSAKPGPKPKRAA